MIWAVRPDGFADYHNARFVDYVGVRTSRYLAKTGPKFFIRTIASARATPGRLRSRDGTEYRIEYRIRDGKTGEYRWFLRHALPQRDACGRVVRWFGTCTDIDERRRAEEALRNSAERLHVVSRRVVEVQEEERRHIARELHDEIGQVLSAISVNLHAVNAICEPAVRPRIEESIQIVDQATHQVRNLSLDLRPSMLDHLGLAATLRWFTDRQAQRAGFAAHFAAESSGARLNAELSIACFRVAQETLTNVTRHAGARNVWVDMRQADDEIELTIRDDGVGFDPEPALGRAQRGESFGLLGMQERVELLDGRADIRSQQGHGTTVSVWFPITSPQSASKPNEGSE